MYQYTPEINEISGFGGVYKDMCRKMVIAGLEWFDQHPDSNPKFHGFKDVYGICMEDNDDAKALSDAIVSPSNNGCTGAMHQAAVSHVMWIHAHSWNEYVVEMSKKR